MKSLYATPHVARLVLGTIAALALLAAMSAVAASEPITSDQFAPGWQAHAHPLIYSGTVPRSGQGKWYVPQILQRGEYVVIRLEGDKAELVDGHRFVVKSGFVDQTLLLDEHGNLQALPIEDVPALKPAPATAAALIR